MSDEDDAPKSVAGLPDETLERIAEEALFGPSDGKGRGRSSTSVDGTALEEAELELALLAAKIQLAHLPRFDPMPADVRQRLQAFAFSRVADGPTPSKPTEQTTTGASVVELATRAPAKVAARPSRMVGWLMAAVLFGGLLGLWWALRLPTPTGVRTASSGELPVPALETTIPSESTADDGSPRARVEWFASTATGSLDLHDPVRECAKGCSIWVVEAGRRLKVGTLPEGGEHVALSGGEKGRDIDEWWLATSEDENRPLLHGSRSRGPQTDP